MTKSEIIPDYENLPLSPGYKSFLPDIGPLMCDLYALTMTQAAFTLGFVDDTYSTSNVFCRSLINNGQFYTDTHGEKKPVKIPYLINAGIGLVAEWLDGWQFKPDDLRYLAGIRLPTTDGSKGARLFSNEFLFWLSKQRIRLDIDAMPEGEMIFPQEPALRIHGLWWQQQMVEAAILSLVSSSTNNTTIALQVRLATQRMAMAEGATLIEASADPEKASLADMSLRRSLSIGALQSARAAFMTGWDNTSNVYAGKCYGIPVMGTFAHSWVMLHDTEEAAFDNWAKAYPGTTLFLADTYNTVEGIKSAIRVCKKYGLKLKGIRLDSGNMAYLSNITRQLLDAAGFTEAKIIATDGVNTRAAYNLFGNARSEVTGLSSHITGFGIGSENAVNQNQPLLNEVMKLAAVYKDPKALAREVLKLSETREKTTLPGEIDVIRYLRPTTRGLRFAGDTIVPLGLDLGKDALAREVISIHAESGAKKPFLEGTRFYRPLQPWMRNGEMMEAAYREKKADRILLAARTLCSRTVAQLDPEHLTIDMPHRYGWGIEQSLLAKRDEIADRHHMAAAREFQRQRFQLVA